MLLQRCDSPLLLAATRCAIGLAEARGWSAATIAGVFYGLKAVLDGHTGDDPVPLSQVRQRVRPRSHSSATRIAEVLAELGMLHDDTTAAIRTWIDRRTGELPAGFGRDVRAWLVVLLDGDARTRPRSHATVRVPLRQGAALHRVLGSNTRPPAGDHLRRRRHRPGAAARPPALQRHHRAALAVPVRQTTRPDVRRPHPAPRGGRGAGRTVLPMTAEQIRAVQQAAATPAQRLAIALAAVHAARPGAIRELTLEDIDLPSRRITLAGHRQPLGELTRNALLAWLGLPARHLAGHRQPARPGHAHKRPGHRAGLRQLPRRLPRQAPAARHLPRAHPARPHPARSPGHRRRPAPPCPGLQHRPHQRDGLRQRRPQPSQQPRP